MKKYNVALQKYDELCKIGIPKWVTRLMMWSICLFWIIFIVTSTVFFKNNYFVQIGLLVMMVLTVGVFMTMILMNFIKQDKFRKENKEYFKYSKKNILEFLQIKSKRFSPNHISDYINILIDEHYNDKDKLKKELYDYVHNDKFINDMADVMNYEDLSKEYDVDV